MKRYTIVNDQLLPAEEASLLITDLAIQRGYGIFDFFKTVDGAFRFLDDHLDRFYRSAAAMHLPITYTREELKALLSTLQEKNQLPDSGIRITLTGGYSPDGYSITAPNMVITQNVLPKVADNEKGIKLMTYPHQRQLPEVKTLDYLMAIYLQPTLQKSGADDILYHDNGFMKECPRSNFFIVTNDDEVVTSNKNILAGVVRKQVLSLKVDGVKLVEREISFDDLKHCKEAFVTSSTKNILAVTAIDGQQIGNGMAGEITKSLAQAFQELN